MDWKKMTERQKGDPTTGVLSFRKLSPRSMSVFCQQLSALLSAGMTLPEGWVLAASGIKEKKFRKAVQQVSAEIEMGKSLPEGIKKAGCLPALFKEMIGVAGETGGISEILTVLSTYYRRQDHLRSEIFQVTLYPALVLILSIMIVVFLLTQVVPIFTAIIESLSGEVPLFTRIMIDIGAMLAKGWLLLIPIAMIFLLMKYLMLNHEDLRKNWGLMKLKLPLIGTFLMDHACMQMTYGLSLLLQGGVNLPEALRACRGIVGNDGLSAALEKIRKGIISGKMMTACMIETGIFPRELLQMVCVGEEAGSLTETLEKASEYYRGNFSRRTKMLTTLLEPAILIFVGLMVLIVMLAMLQPIYEVYECYVNMI